jgi:hypothetical protein
MGIGLLRRRRVKGPSGPQSPTNALSGTHPLSQSTVFLNAVKDLRLPFGAGVWHNYRVVQYTPGIQIV